MEHYRSEGEGGGDGDYGDEEVAYGREDDYPGAGLLKDQQYDSDIEVDEDNAQLNNQPGQALVQEPPKPIGRQETNLAEAMKYEVIDSNLRGKDEQQLRSMLIEVNMLKEDRALQFSGQQNDDWKQQDVNYVMFSNRATQINDSINYLNNKPIIKDLQKLNHQLINDPIAALQFQIKNEGSQFIPPQFKANMTLEDQEASNSVIASTNAAQKILLDPTVEQRLQVVNDMAKQQFAQQTANVMNASSFIKKKIVVPTMIIKADVPTTGANVFTQPQFTLENQKMPITAIQKEEQEEEKIPLLLKAKKDKFPTILNAIGDESELLELYRDPNKKDVLAGAVVTPIVKTLPVLHKLENNFFDNVLPQIQKEIISAKQLI